MEALTYKQNKTYIGSWFHLNKVYSGAPLLQYPQCISSLFFIVWIHM